MPISRIKTDGIQDDAVTQPKIIDNITLDGTEFVRVPAGTTAQRPSSAAGGQLRFNTDLGTLEQYNTATNSWQAIDSPPIISSLAITGSATAADPAGGETITLTGSNFKANATVTIGGTSANSVSVVSSSSITFTTPAKTAGDYDVVVTNTNGLAATLQNGISYNGTPAFTTAAGNVGSIAEDQAMSTITIVAAEPDGGTLAFSVTSGALPTGVSMSSVGAITGTPNVNPTSNTTFNFTVTATDNENQTNSRAFNLIVLRPIYATQISNSLRFDYGSSSHLTRTVSGTPTLGTKGTVSAWVKRITVENGTGNTQYWFHVGTGTDNSGHMDLKFGTSDGLSIGRYSDTPYNGGNRYYKDVSDWLHIVVSFDSTSATASDRQMKVYVNGVQRTDGTFGAIGQNDVFPFTKNGNAIFIGKHATVGRPFDGYIADFHLIDGQALTPTSFAEEFNGVWCPITYSGTYGTNGFHLEFADSSNLGDDTSGNTNDLTASGLSAQDSTPDSPTINFSTMNYNRRYYDWVGQGQLVTLSNGALTGNVPSAGAGIDSTMGMNSGKWYWEIRKNSGNWYAGVGLGRMGKTGAVSKYRASTNGELRVFAAENHGNDYNGTSLATSLYSISDGDVLGFALNIDDLELKLYKNGTLVHTETSIYNPKTDNDFYTAAFSNAAAGNFTMNFGQDPTFNGNETAPSTDKTDGNGRGKFLYDVPTGHLAMNSANLAESTINTTIDDRPEDYMTTTLYTGNGTGQSITTGFQPDLVWLKQRNGTQTHQLLDTVRGKIGGANSFARLRSDTTAIEATPGSDSGLQSMDSNGFTLGSDAAYNGNNNTYVAWTWKAGGAPTATNSATSGAMTANSVSLNGTLQSAYTPSGSPTLYPTKMSINTKAGFSIVSWTGDGSVRTLPHGLNQKPEFFILRGRDARAWATYHEQYVNYPNTGNYYAQLNGTTPSADNAMFNSTAPTDDVFTIGSYHYVSSVNYIGYFWHSVPGYSHIGEWKNVGENLGTYIYCGFKPSWVIIRCISAAENWYIIDNKRMTGNLGTGQTIALNPNTTTAESGVTQGSVAVDFVANGFKIRSSNTGSGEISFGTRKYAFMAFAEDPFKYAEAR